MVQTIQERFRDFLIDFTKMIRFILRADCDKNLGKSGNKLKMPSTPTQKTLEIRKSFCDQVSDDESGKIESANTDLMLDNTSRSTGGAGETPVKKLLKKSTKVEDDKIGKNINSVVVDKIPKKNAQRAKGFISLNKAIEKTGIESTEKKRLSFDPSDSVSTLREDDNVENTKSNADGRKASVPVRYKRSKTKTGTKKQVKKDSKDPKSKSQKPWTDAVEKLSSGTLDKKVTEEMNSKEEFSEVQNSEVGPMNPPFSTCSFFEKLQQGVKSYFSSKNSFTSYDKNKKEGGSRTRAGVENGVKEDAKKKDAGLLLKNDIYNLKSDLFHDELRSNSNLGGHSNNFSNDKPKIFRKLKRKKLYHPKKHYVRIQIPRKGYFYRSTVQFKTPGSSSGQFEQLEPSDGPKSKSKIQIPGMASTSSKISSLPNKKRVKAKQENAQDGSNAGFSLDYWDGVGFAFNEKKMVGNFEQKFNDYLVLSWQNNSVLSQEKKKLLLKEDEFLDLVNPEPEGEQVMSAISERIFKSNCQKAMGRVKKTSLNMGNEFSDVLDITSERTPPTFRKQNGTPASTLETLMNYLNSTLKNDKLFCDLEITPVDSVREDLRKTYTDPSNPPEFPEIPLPFTDILNVFNDCNYSSMVDDSSKFGALYLSPVPPAAFFQPAMRPTISLLEDIDLHLELQNYLKGYNSLTKNNTKSMEESNFDGCADYQKERKKFAEFRGSKSSSSNASAASYGSSEGKTENRMVLDSKRDVKSLSEECLAYRPSKTSQIRFMEESNGIRKVKSENNPRTLPQDSKLNSSVKRTFGKTSFQRHFFDDKENAILQHSSSASKDLSIEDSTNSCEKITPFDLRSNRSCDDTKTRNKSRVLFENRGYSFSAESMAQQRAWKVASDTNHSETKSYSNFKIIKLVRSKSSTTEVTLPSNARSVSDPSEWSPSLQDLIDIYNSVLKQSKKIKKNSTNSVKNCFSSHLFAFLNKKLQEKQFKADLIKLSKDLNSNYKPPKPWKLLKEKEDSVSLKEYVAMFQEILQSSLSISQIARLNNIISSLQDHSENNFRLFKDLKKVANTEAETKKIAPAIEKVKTVPKTDAVDRKKSKTHFPTESLKNTMEFSKPLNTFSEIGGRKTKKSKTEKLKKEELSSPYELECLLRTCFDSPDVLGDDNEHLNLKNKLLVTVKVSGNRILVNRLSNFNDEDELPSLKTGQGETSELIIENITRNQVRGALHRHSKFNSIKELKPSNTEETSNGHHPKSSNGKTSKVRKSQKQAQVKVKEIASPSSTEAEYLLQHQNISSETIFPFEYDQMQLRAQHPIEAIIESSESKISEISESSHKSKSELSFMTEIYVKDRHNDSTVLKQALKDALAENVFVKDLISNLDWSEEQTGKTLGPIKSYVMRRQTANKREASIAKENQTAEMVRSMVELNTRTWKNRKSRKALPTRMRDTYLCYPFLHNFQVKTSKSIQKSKEKINDKNLACTTSRPAAKSTTQHIAKSEIHKRMSEDFELKRQYSQSATNVSQTLVSKARPTKATTNRSSSNTMLHLNNELVSDSCSIELFVSENIDDLLALSVSGCAKQDLSIQPASEQFPCQIQTGVVNFNHSPVAPLLETLPYEVKDSPIVLHPAKSDLDDLSSPSMIIHSDSFLKKFSGFSVPLTKPNSLFKSKSDMKFYSGILPKQKSETKPFVTFVLTPKQKKMAGVSSEKIHIVTKSNVVEFSAPAPAPTLLPTPDAHSDTQENKSSDKIVSLQSVEKFSELSKCRERAMTPEKSREKKPPQKNMQSSSSCKRKKKCFIPNQSSLIKQRVERKSHQESQKTKKDFAGIAFEIKKPAKKSEKLKENQKKIKTVERKRKSEKTHAFVSNEMKDFIKTLETEGGSGAGKGESEKCEENKKKITVKAVGYNKNSRKTVTNDVNSALTEKGVITNVDVGTETEGTLNGNSMKPLNSSNFLQELLETLQTILIQAEDFKNKAEIISIIEKQLTDQKLELCEESAAARESFGNPSMNSKKLKNIKIKIFCCEPTDPVDSNKPEDWAEILKAKNTDLLEESPLLERDLGSERHERSIKEISMLNSLVSGGKAKDGDLERQNSTYFDALEKNLPEEKEGTGKEMGDTQIMYQRPLEGILDLNAEFGVKEAKSQSRSPLTSSDEKLLTKESEEAIIIKITKSLNEDKISHSMALLDEFLKKAENSFDHKDTCLKLRQILLLIENKNRNLMNMERKAWLKVLSLLEEISQIIEDEDIEGSIRNYLLVTKAFIKKIHSLNASRPDDLQDSCCDLSQRPIPKTNGNHMEKIYRKMCESLHFLKEKFTLKPSFICRKEENFRGYQNRNQDSESRFGVESRTSLPEIP